MDVDGRKLLLRIVREAISQNPTSVGKIIREVCRLPDSEAKSFSRLLDDIPLGNVVHLARMVADRLASCLCLRPLFTLTRSPAD